MTCVWGWGWGVERKQGHHDPIFSWGFWHQLLILEHNFGGAINAYLSQSGTFYSDLNLSLPNHSWVNLDGTEDPCRTGGLLRRKTASKESGLA